MSDPTITVTTHVASVETPLGSRRAYVNTTHGYQRLLIARPFPFTGVPPLVGLVTYHPWNGPTEREVQWYLTNVIGG